MGGLAGGGDENGLSGAREAWRWWQKLAQIGRCQPRAGKWPPAARPGGARYGATLESSGERVPRHWPRPVSAASHRWASCQGATRVQLPATTISFVFCFFFFFPIHLFSSLVFFSCLLSPAGLRLVRVHTTSSETNSAHRPGSGLFRTAIGWPSRYIWPDTRRTASSRSPASFCPVLDSVKVKRQAARVWPRCMIRPVPSVLLSRASSSRTCRSGREVVPCSAKIGNSWAKLRSVGDRCSG